MARPTAPKSRVVSGNGHRIAPPHALSAAAQVFAKTRRANPNTDRSVLAKAWQYEAYRQVNICGEARYAAALFASLAARAELGIGEPNALGGKATWVNTGAEVTALAELVPNNRARKKIIRDYMLHRVIAGESYLIARERLDVDPGYIPPPEGWDDWDTYLRSTIQGVDFLDPEFSMDDLLATNPNVENAIWEVVAVTEIRRTGTVWSVRHENGNWIDLRSDDPVIRMWAADPADRLEAWSPFRSLLPTLREIEFFTEHIFTQVRSRLMSSGVWFLPDNLTFPMPPADQVNGGEEAIAAMNEAEQFMVSLALSSTNMIDADEVSFPTVVMADPNALEQIDQQKLIKFWSEIDDKAMLLRSAAVQRFALGMDMPPEQILGASGLAVTGSAGSAGSVNHWGVWANEEQTITGHIEPALDDFVETLTVAYLQIVVPDTDKVVAYDTAGLRLRQDRSKEALELNDRGLLNNAVTLREVGFDPEHDAMSDEEFRKWLLVRITGGSPTPDQVQAALQLLGTVLPVPYQGPNQQPPGLPGRKSDRNAPPNLDDHPVQGPPTEQHDHTPAPFSALHASCEAVVLRALEKSGARLLNAGTRGRDRDRRTPAHLAHVTLTASGTPEFDFTLLPTLLMGYSANKQAVVAAVLREYCVSLYANQEPYSREGLMEAMEGL